MEGYSVTEAASILGVPIERVWELLARGVLAGQPEGETGMRVFLQPRPAPAPVPERPNGNGGGRGAAESDREVSPFRELLTEFRNLTERYGQALLALGEARGETAALRSRVDLLEARMDLRLPMPAPTSTGSGSGAWPIPSLDREARGVDARSRSDAADHAAAIDDGADEHDDERPARRRRAHRRATENFAEALARAEDPTRPELPGARDAAAALAALREDTERAEATEAVLPRELPAADPIPMADEPADARRDEASTAEPMIDTDASAPAPDEPDLAPEAEEAIAETEDDADTVDATIATAPVAEPEPSTVVQASPPPAPVPTPESVEAASEAATGARAGAPPPAIPWDPERYTVEIADPDWIVDEEEVAPRASDAEPPAPAEPGAAQPAEPAATSEETMLWYGRSAAGPTSSAEPETEAVRSEEPATPPSTPLDDALAALDAIAGRGPAATAPSEREPGTDSTSSETPTAPEAPPAPVPPAPARPATPFSTPPTTRAYRRLRRIFPG